MRPPPTPPAKTPPPIPPAKIPPKAPAKPGAAADPDAATEGTEAAPDAEGAETGATKVGDALQARLDALAKQSPAPTEVIPVSVVANLVDALNGAIGFLSNGEAPTVKFVPPGDKGTGTSAVGGIKAPLPGDVFAILAATALAITAAADQDPSLASMTFNPMEDIKTKAGMQQVTSKLMDAARSDALKKAIQEGMAQAPAPEAGPPAPTKAPAAPMGSA